MLYLTGATNLRDEPALITAGIGVVVRRGNSYWRWCERYPFHGADIGMGYMDADLYLDWLDRVPRARCLYAVSPDAYPDAVESLRRGMEYAAIIRAMGFPVALVAQDGAEHLDWPWDDFDVLFIGGKMNPGHPRREWKTGLAAEKLCAVARGHGKWVHMGRVNSWWKIERARAMGCNSADGTFLKHRNRKRKGEHDGAVGGRGASELSHWLNGLACTPMLPSLGVFEAPSLPIHREMSQGDPTTRRDL